MRSVTLSSRPACSRYRDRQAHLHAANPLPGLYTAHEARAGLRCPIARQGPTEGPGLARADRQGDRPGDAEEEQAGCNRKQANTFASVVEDYLRLQVIGPDPEKPRQRKGRDVAGSFAGCSSPCGASGLLRRSPRATCWHSLRVCGTMARLRRSRPLERGPGTQEARPGAGPQSAWLSEDVLSLGGCARRLWP